MIFSNGYLEERVRFSPAGLKKPSGLKAGRLKKMKETNNEQSTNLGAKAQRSADRPHNDTINNSTSW